MAYGDVPPAMRGTAYEFWKNFGFSTRAAKVLHELGIGSLLELMRAEEAQILRAYNGGRR